MRRRERVRGAGRNCPSTHSPALPVQRWCTANNCNSWPSLLRRPQRQGIAPSRSLTGSRHETSCRPIRNSTIDRRTSCRPTDAETRLPGPPGAGDAPRAGWTRLLAATATVSLLFVGKLKFLLIGLTKISTLASMFGFIAVYWSIHGWPWRSASQGRFPFMRWVTWPSAAAGRSNRVRRYSFLVLAPW